MIENLQLGQVVFSKCGRDKRRSFVILRKENEYVFLADGELRPLNKPKKKKEMHIQVTKDVLDDIKAKLESGAHLMDSDIRTALKPYSKNVDL